MDNQKQQPQDQLESSFYDFLTDFSSVLKKHGIDDPVITEELDKLKTSEILLDRLHEVRRRLKCRFEWEDGVLQVKCTTDA